MPFMPFQILGMWLRGLFTLALIAGAIALATIAYRYPAEITVERPREPTPDDPRETETVVVPGPFGVDRRTAYLTVAGLLGLWSLGGWLYLPVLRRGGGKGPAKVEPTSVQRLRQPDGAELHVETFGPPDAPTLVFTHGWGLSAEEWRYAQKELAGHFRLVCWDLPGLGRSKGPDDRDWSLDRMAGYLNAVVEAAGGPVVLVGHSIGGMITLTYCRLFAASLGPRVRGLVIAQSTYTNPVMTNEHTWLYAPLQKPVLEPLCYLMIGTAPLVWLMNMLSYVNGSAHDSTESESFSGRETGGQLDFIVRTWVPAWPAVVARGFLGMFRYDATATLPTIPVPALIVAGDSDTLCLPSASQHMARTIPGARLVVLRSSRHAGLFEHHGEFDEEVGRFAAECLG